MLAYHFKADGRALEAEIVVLANCLREAHGLAEAWCRENQVKPETVMLVRSVGADKPGVVFGWIVDY